MLSIGNDKLEVNFLSRGAAVYSLYLRPFLHSMVLGTHDKYAYEIQGNYMGVIAGPVVNRITNARAFLEGQLLNFDKNNGENVLHGGRCGLSELDWEVIENRTDEIIFGITYADNEMGYPGPIDFRAHYKIVGRKLWVEIHAISAKTTLMNPASHIYFNLSGAKKIDDHRLWINAARYLEVDKNALATGQICNTDTSDFDFSTPKKLDGIVLDNCFPLRETNIYKPALVLSTEEIAVELTTNQCAVQVYTGEHFAQQALVNFQNEAVSARAGFAIEPQNWANAPSFPHFPSIILKANEKYLSRSCFEFRTF